MRICYETALEMANALLDAIHLINEHGEAVIITTTKENKWIALIGDEDTGVRFKVDPPIEEPDGHHLRIVA